MTDWSDVQSRARFVRDNSLLKRLGKIKVVDGLTSESSVRDVLYQTWAMTAGFKRHANYKVRPLYVAVYLHADVRPCLIPSPPPAATSF